MFPSEFLERLSSGDASVPGQSPVGFGRRDLRHLSDETQSAFSDARKYWNAFQARLARSTESRTTITREDWVVRFLELLGFEKIVVNRSSLEIGRVRYLISHSLGDHENATPLHVVSIEQGLESREGSRRSPHALMQEYLNNSDALWGIVTNGARLRLLRDSGGRSKPTYVEFDLEGMVTGNAYAEFILLYRLLHASRLPSHSVAAHECLLERYFQLGIEDGGRVRERLRDGVEKAISRLGAALVKNLANERLRARIAEGSLSPVEFYRQVLRVVYRCLFLMTAEERGLLFTEEQQATTRQLAYMRYYSLSMLRTRAEQFIARDTHVDLWLGLLQAFSMLRDSGGSELLGLSPLNGELFGDAACPDLETAMCSNDEFLLFIRNLSTFTDNGYTRRVNYAGLDVEEFGSVYESLLDFHPQIDVTGWNFELAAGSERKQTGSYYTPPELVRELVNSSLRPVLEERLRSVATVEGKEAALLNLKVCDPASGSGHFLLAAARCIARELANVRSGDSEPSPTAYRHALRDVVRHCVYAVDKNPLAVDLCKVALWIEGHHAGFPLSFLDHHIKCGDSVVGVADLHMLWAGIPDGAYSPIADDERGAARRYLYQNRAVQNGGRQMELGEPAPLQRSVSAIEDDFAALASLEESNPSDVRAKEDLYYGLRKSGGGWWALKEASDLWCAAFFLPLVGSDELNDTVVPTTATIRQCLQGYVTTSPLANSAAVAAKEYSYFHWPLEFPDVFGSGGFDVVLGNPPWEQLQAKETEFFAARAPQIAALSGAQRKSAIARLPSENPDLANEWTQYCQAIERSVKFVRGSGRFPLSARGKLNTYALFTELARTLLKPDGRLGVVVPSGVATDFATSSLFADMVGNKALISLYDFENREGVFPGVHRSYKFCLLTVGGREIVSEESQFAFFLLRASDLRDEQRRFSIPSTEIDLLNPNTRTCPIFRDRRDARIVTDIYRRVPVLVNERTDSNPWGLTLRQGLFNMTSDCGLFEMAGAPDRLPLYEAKMMHQFDHRWASYCDDDFRDLTEETKREAHLSVRPRYWVHGRDVEARLPQDWRHEWLLASRLMARSTDERSLMASIIPKSGVGHSACLWFPNSDVANSAVLALVACLNSFVADYVVAAKVGGANLSEFLLKQLAILAPDELAGTCPWDKGTSVSKWMEQRAIELSYTAWSLQPFATDMGYDGAPFRWESSRRTLLRCELDAAYFLLYGMEREDVDYVMETFPIVKRKDESKYGEFRTKGLILQMYDEMAASMRDGTPFQTHLNPPPADLRVAHANQ